MPDGTITLRAPARDDAIWQIRPQASPRLRLAPFGPSALFAAAVGLWSLPWVMLGDLFWHRAELRSGIDAVARLMEHAPLQVALGSAAATLYLGASALLLAAAAARATCGWRRRPLIGVRLAIAPAMLLSLAAWTALAGCAFFNLMLWIYALQS
ncbi:MAG TPA: hypothetical protein VMC10_19265 [Stellaceae bacterium]|nr:hypothetical protein [Stellaceae bacterium]